MEKQIEQMRGMASSVVRSILGADGSPDVAFKTMVELETGGDKALLLGSVHRDFNDAHCIAILNPVAKLVERLQPAVGFSAVQLREIVRGKCDAMMRVMFLGKTERVRGTYQARRAWRH